MKHYLWETLLLSLGLAVLGLFVYFGLNSLGNRERVVAVRGLAEREVKADRVIWPVVYKTTGNDLPALYGQLNDVSVKIRAFLVENGIPVVHPPIGRDNDHLLGIRFLKEGKSLIRQPFGVHRGDE